MIVDRWAVRSLKVRIMRRQVGMRLLRQPARIVLDVSQDMAAVDVEHVVANEATTGMM